MKWFVFMFVTTVTALTVTPEVKSGSFDPVTGAYTTDPITVTLTPKTVTASASVIPDGEKVFWAPAIGSGNYVQENGLIYWGSHTYSMTSNTVATAAAASINARGTCTATASGASLTINGCFTFKVNYDIRMGKGATCKSFFGSGNEPYVISSFGTFVQLKSNNNGSQSTRSLTRPDSANVGVTTLTYPRQTFTTMPSSSSYDTNLQATLSAATPPSVFLYCTVTQGALTSLASGSTISHSFILVPSGKRPAYAPTISYSPALPITNTIAVNIRNIAAIEILPSTVFNTGTISAWRTTYMEQPLTVTRQGNLTRKFGASENFNVIESWTCATTGQIDFRIMRDNTNTNVCSGATYTHTVQTPQSLTAQWKALNQTSSGAWSAAATVTFTLP